MPVVQMPLENLDDLCGADVVDANFLAVGTPGDEAVALRAEGEGAMVRPLPMRIPLEVHEAAVIPRQPAPVRRKGEPPAAGRKAAGDFSRAYVPHKDVRSGAV